MGRIEKCQIDRKKETVTETLLVFCESGGKVHMKRYSITLMSMSMGDLRSREDLILFQQSRPTSEPTCHEPLLRDLERWREHLEPIPSSILYQ